MYVYVYVCMYVCLLYRCLKMAGVSPVMVVMVVISAATLLHASHVLPSPRPRYAHDIQSLNDLQLYLVTLQGREGGWAASGKEESLQHPYTPTREVKKRALTLISLLRPRPNAAHDLPPLPHPEDSKRPYGKLRWGR